MPIINVLQHLFSSVERGYDPRRKRGFQTVAVAEELVGTEDLQVLEDAAFYAVSTVRRAAKDFPVKETFFHLPSGRFAIGRTVNWGTDSLGREGNYLTHHLVCTREDLLAAGANPFAILDSARLAEAGSDLTPRALPPLALDVAPVASVEGDLRTLAGVNAELLAHLAAAVVDGGAQTALLVGAEAQSRQVLRELFAALALEERLRLTFATHFYEANHLRSLFALVTVNTRTEAPSQRESYAMFDVESGEFPRVPTASAYTEWLAGCLRAGRWQEVTALNAALDTLRSGAAFEQPLPTNAPACAALWERAGVKVAPALVGNAPAMTAFLHHISAPRQLAETLLASAGPAELCGLNAAPETAQTCLSALRVAATGKVWREWRKRWHDDPALAGLVSEAKPWWQVWKRG